jgi:hypothetical protein
LELGGEWFALNKILALIEQLKREMDTVSQEPDRLSEIFVSKMPNIRKEYEKASRLLKECHETTRLVAQNIRS